MALAVLVILSTNILSQTVKNVPKKGGLTVTSDSIDILGNKIAIKIYENTSKRTPLIFVSLHHNERLGRHLAKNAIEAKGGKMFEVVSVESNRLLRNVHFKHAGRELCIDPNRVFSEDGIKATLSYSDFGEGCENVKDAEAIALTKSVEVVNAIRAFQVKLLSWILPKTKNEILVSVHNNLKISLDNFYDINDNDEFPNNEGTYIAHTDLVNADKEYNHDFFMVSNNSLFAKLVAARRDKDDKQVFSIAVQKENPNEKKGYLSTFCSRNGHNYILIEAKHKLGEIVEGHDQRQKDMIDRVFTAFASQK